MLTFAANQDNTITIWYAQVQAGLLEGCQVVFASMGQPTAPPVLVYPTVTEHVDRYTLAIPYSYSGNNLTAQDYRVEVQRLVDYVGYETVWTDLCKVIAA